MKRLHAAYTILIVEDEWRIARFLQMELEHAGYRTEIESDGCRAWERIAQGDFSLLLIDVMLPGMDGFEICRRTRKISNVPILLLTARDALEDKVDGLDCGADDYITKPFQMPELLARIRAALRKTGASRACDDEAAQTLTLKELRLDLRRHEATVAGEAVELTKKEYDLLEYLLRNKGTVLTREQILSAVWGYDYLGDTNVVDVYIRYLRAKLDERFGQKYIHTVRGVGYAAKD